jgi:long-chain acyl-CoA synthetase
MPSTAPWLARYDPGVPPTLAPYPPRTLLDYLSEAARDRPAAAALLFKGAAVSNASLERLSDALAHALDAVGVRRGDRVALLLANCPQFFIAELAVWKLGAIVAPLNPLYADPEIERPLCDHGIETIITLTRFYRRVKSLQARTPLRRVIATNIKEYFPPLVRALFTLLRESREGDRIRLAPEDHDFAHLIRSHAGAPSACMPPAGHDPAVLLMSGGTTGTPKGVVGTHAAYVAAGLQIHAWLSQVVGRGDVILLPLPLFHVYANVGVQALGLVAGCPLAIVPNPRDLSDLLATIRRVRPAFFNGVPTLYVALLGHRLVQSGHIDFKSIKICFSGAAPLMAETKQRFEALTGGRIVEGYSLTEAMMAACVNPVVGPNKLGSVGMPLPDVLVRIADPDDGTRVLAAGAVGEICLSAPQLMRGFWNRPDESAAVLRDHPEDGGTRRWLHTGDLGYLDDDGYLFIVDRMKDLIKTSGYQVWPREVEEVLAAHPAIAECGVAGMPDAAKGEVVQAWIVLRANQQASEAEIRAFCRERLAPYKIPARIEFRSTLPKTMVGKVLRRVLKEGG